MAHGPRELPADFQPAGRAPAPAPLDLVQAFVNTEIPEWARDAIASPAALAAWFRARGLLRPDEDVDADAFVAARALRSVLRELALLNTTGRAPDEALRADAAAALSLVPLAAVLGEDGRLAVAGTGAAGSRALGVLVGVVLEAQANGDWLRLKACAKDSCRWLFYDGSRNRSSSWCSMSICGNRVKTAAYRRRRGGP